MNHPTERIFHCTHDGAYKYWVVTVEDCVQTVRFGRIGTAGQTHCKTFATAVEAHVATEQLIAQKQAKGYVMVTAEEHRQASPKPLSVAAPQLLLSFDKDAENTNNAEPKAAVVPPPPLFALDL